MIHPEAVIGVIAMLGVFGSIILGLYLFFTTRNKERMALIDQGIDASIFTSKRRGYSNNTLKFGMLFFGIGVGILVGTLLDAMGMQEEPAYFSSMFIFGGLGLIGYYRIASNKSDDSLEA